MKLEKLIKKLMGIRPPTNIQELEEEGYVSEKAISTDYRIYKKDGIVALYNVKKDEVVDWRVANGNIK